MEWLEANIDNAVKGFDAIVVKMFDQLRVPERLAIVQLLQRGERKHLVEIADDLSLDRNLVAHHEKALEKWGIVSSELDDAPEDYPAVLVRYVKVTPIGVRMLECLEAEGVDVT